MSEGHRMNARERAVALMLLALLLGAWEAAARLLGLSALVLPPPSGVLQTLWQGLASGYLWPHLRATASALLLGRSRATLDPAHGQNETVHRAQTWPTRSSNAPTLSLCEL